MVKVGGFYVDGTEVTNAHYALFQQAMGDDTSGQAPECAWNDSFDPAFMQSAPMPASNEPVTNVDYCDAAAFCTWADKRLCGKIGGGTLASSELADPTKSQWFRACGGTASQGYPYGTKYQAGYCNDSASGINALAPVATESKCQGYVTGLFDMLGNAAEWTAVCDGNAGPQDGCETIGGSYKESWVCSQSGLVHRQEQSPTLGFRCCSR